MTATNAPVYFGRYQYHFLPSLDSDRIVDVAGNYIFSKYENGLWVPLYIGCTPNGGTLRSRLPGHEKWEPARLLGAKWVWAHTNANSIAMCEEERQLISQFNPVLNTQHRTVPTPLAELFYPR